MARSCLALIFIAAILAHGTEGQPSTPPSNETQSAQINSTDSTNSTIDQVGNFCVFIGLTLQLSFLRPLRSLTILKINRSDARSSPAATCFGSPRCKQFITRIWRHWNCVCSASIGRRCYSHKRCASHGSGKPPHL
jgi:hypothetical protein